MFDCKPEAVLLPEPTRASRKVVTKSRVSARGELVATVPADKHRRKFVFESKLEQRFLFLALLDHDVHDIWDQPDPITYRNLRGTTTTHTFDFLVTLKDRRKIAVAVKSKVGAIRSGFKEELKTIARQLPYGFADDVALFTELSFGWEESRNAEWLHHFRWPGDPEADLMVENAAKSIGEPRKIQEIVDLVGMNGRGFAAVMRLIAAGRLLCVSPGLIDDLTLVAWGDRS